MDKGCHGESPDGGRSRTAAAVRREKQVELATRAQLDECVRPSGITALQYTALTVLARQTFPISSAALARLSFVRAQSIADLVGALERRGLVQRRQDPSNRRRLLISLTADGDTLLAELEPAVHELEERMLHGMSTAERRMFADLLNRSRQNLA